MNKIAFIGNSEPPDKLLEIFKKMTPGSSGIWKNLIGVDNYKDADYFAVIDYIPYNVKISEKKCVFLGAHPQTLKAYRSFRAYNGIKMYDCKHIFGFGEWWIKYNYDYLKALQPITKTKQLGCIVSNADVDKSHFVRKEWLRRFTSREDLKDFDLHGRIVPDTSMTKFYKGVCGSPDYRGSAISSGNNHMIGKEEVYEQHKYMLEFDNIGTHYFSERIFDCLLLWGMPIYFGGKFVHEYIPKDSFKYLSIEESGDDVLNIINNNTYENNIDEIAKARNILLDKLQIWPRVHEAIFGES